MRKVRREPRRKTGVTNIIEFGPTMWIVFIVITFPLLTFGTIGLRYAFVNNAVCYAAEAAAQSNSFLVDPDATHKSAVNSANAVMAKANTSWNGINVNVPTDVTTSIIIEPLGGASSPTKVTGRPLNAAEMALQTQNVYTVQVTVRAIIQPLFPQNYWQGGMSNIPGLNAPIIATVSQQKYFEDPGALNK